VLGSQRSRRTWSSGGIECSVHLVSHVGPTLVVMTSKHRCDTLGRYSREWLPYIQREVCQLATARFFDVGRQLILPSQRCSFVDELAFLVISRARLTQLLAPGACWVSFVTLQQHGQHSGSSQLQAEQDAYLDSALTTSIAGSLSRRARGLLRHRWR